MKPVVLSDLDHFFISLRKAMYMETEKNRVFTVTTQGSAS